MCKQPGASVCVKCYGLQVCIMHDLNLYSMLTLCPTAVSIPATNATLPRRRANAKLRWTK